MKIAYCVCFFFEERRFNRVSGIYYDQYYFLEKHLQFVKKRPKKINTVYFVINKSESTDVEKIIDIVNSYNINKKITVMFRENIDFSYGAWNDIIKKDFIAGGHDYYFLIEDDYIPKSTNFIDAFLDRMKENIAYVAVRTTPPTDADIQNLTQRIGLSIDLAPKIHASISNGLLNGAAAKHILKNKDNIFLLYESTSYEMAETNQLMFLETFTTEGYAITDISDQYSAIFNHNLGNLEQMGEGDDIIIPIRGDLNDITF